MKLHFSKMEHNMLFASLNNNDIVTALSYLVDFKKHVGLNITPRTHSIEVSNSDITIAVILFVGFEENEFIELQKRNNLHIITFSPVIPSMFEFQNLNIKYIDNLSLLFTALSLSNIKELKDLNNLRFINT